MHNTIKGVAACVICAMVWGFAFSAQSSAMDHVGPYTFLFFRSVITCAALLAAWPLLQRFGASEEGASLPGNRLRFLAAGALCGAALATASILQQIGLVTTTPAKSGFITALYILIVPLLGLFVGRRPGVRVWIGAGMSLAGLYFLCMTDRLQLASGDLMTLLCAFVFALHILIVDRWGKPYNPVMLSAIQFATSALIAGALTLMYETPSLEGIRACMGSLLYAAVCSGAIGYTLQIAGQKYLEPAPASLLLCLESVFAALGGWIFLHDALSARELLGCALMFGATIIALMPRYHAHESK